MHRTIIDKTNICDEEACRLRMRSSSKVLIEGLSIIITYFTAASLVELEARRWIRRAYKLERHSVDDERCFDRHQWTAQ